MSDIAPDTLQDSNDLSYLNDDELIRGIEMLFYAYRDFTSDPDEILTKYGFGRAHHRVVHFVGRNPGMTVAELLAMVFQGRHQSRAGGV